MFFDEINQLLPVPDICVRSLELRAGCLVIVAVRHSTNHNHGSCIWQLREVTSHYFASALSQIRPQSHVALPSLLPHHPNCSCTLLQKHLFPLSPNPFGILGSFQGQPVVQNLQKSATAVSQSRGPSRCWFKPFCPRIIGRCFFSRTPASHTFFHLLNEL